MNPLWFLKNRWNMWVKKTKHFIFKYQILSLLMVNKDTNCDRIIYGLSLRYSSRLCVHPLCYYLNLIHKYCYSFCWFGQSCPQLDSHMLCMCCKWVQDKVAQMATLLTCIWDTHSSNFSWHTILTTVVWGLHGPSRHTPGQDLQLSHDYFLPHLSHSLFTTTK
jgi:hypothetical protein